MIGRGPARLAGSGSSYGRSRLVGSTSLRFFASFSLLLLANAPFPLRPFCAVCLSLCPLRSFAYSFESTPLLLRVFLVPPRELYCPLALSS